MERGAQKAEAWLAEHDQRHLQTADIKDLHSHQELLTCNGHRGEEGENIKQTCEDMVQVQTEAVSGSVASVRIPNHGGHD